MTNTFTTTGALTHSTTVTGLVNGGSYNYYVRCQDTAGNPDTTDFAITFTVSADTTPPVRSNGAPSGALPSARRKPRSASPPMRMPPAGIRRLRVWPIRP